jgi:hypothetical protein
MESLKSRAACVGLLLALAGSSGCIAVAVVGGAAAGAGVVYWVEGALRTTLGHPIREVHDATVQVLNNLGVGIVADKTESFTGEIESALRGGSEVRVYLKAVSSSATEVTIRVGTFGDQAQSEMVLNAIEARLGDTRPEAAPKPAGG